MDNIEHKLITSEKEYREFAFPITVEYDDGCADGALGIIRKYDCWDSDEDGNSLDEDGNIIPEDTAENVELEDFITELSYPFIVTYYLDQGYGRIGKETVIFVDFVELSEFNSVKELS